MNQSLKTLRTYASAAALAALCVPALTVPVPAAAQAANPLGQVVEALRAISTLRANFIQTDRSGQSVSGVLTIKRPGRIRFQYQQGVPLLIVGDGKALTLVDYEVKQVQRWPIGNSPLGALLDPSRDVGKFGTLKPTGNPNVISVEVRDRKHPEYGIITLIFTRKASAPGGLELSYWVSLDSQNKRTTVQLSNQQYGVAVPDSAFRWRDPRPNTRR
ncbi:outer membrane lipoprotein carrier protein LolA [Novosphingobium sp. 9U]|uniref:LolA family protein n=1 Tax=Novosphingobium sp. 9U TaxID=2653158 RepID=UPI0012F42240|nr:outer membrane lipoprotein carrier protein LolA [Novosphingobium sp. 9U]VWX54831.1 Outer-membrane lipoprotein carrier protein [Novosphingobium sp. 9U]